MRYSLCLLGLAFLVASPAYADPPDPGFVGAIIYKDGREPDRFACDTLDLVKAIYSVGKENIFSMHPKYVELAATKGIYNEPQCSVGTYDQVRVVDEPVFLGPIDNPIGDAQLFFWAVHVDNTPKGGRADYWVLYLDTKGKHPWLEAGTGI
jgi:hypothetical protein